MRYLALILFFTSILFSSCRKECRFKNLPKEKCNKGFTKLNSSVEEDVFVHSYGGGTVYHRYDSIQHFDTLDIRGKPNFNIDFENETLLGISLTTDFASGVRSNSFMCKNNSNGSLTFKLEYSLSEQCNGSGIAGLPYAFWILMPKISTQTIVNYSVEDINPI